MTLTSPMKQMIMVMTGMLFFFIAMMDASASLPARIVVLPFYVEQGQDIDTGDDETGLHYRRMSGFIENHLVDHGFEVVDPFAKDGSEKELSRLMERAREDSALASMNMASRFAVDIVYVVWMNITARQTQDGYWKAHAVCDGKGYDSSGKSLGLTIMKTFKATRRDLKEAVAVVEQALGDAVGKRLTHWKTEYSGTLPFPGNLIDHQPANADRRINNIKATEKFITVRLDQANVYEVVEAFGKILNITRGVISAKQLHHRIVQNNPQASVTEWELEIDTAETDAFRLQANIMKMVDDILDAGGTIHLKGVPYRYAPYEIKLLLGIFPGASTSRSLQFMIDRQRMQDRELMGIHDPEKTDS